MLLLPAAFHNAAMLNDEKHAFTNIANKKHSRHPLTMPCKRREIHLSLQY